jgi:hypothetical protein
VARVNWETICDFESGRRKPLRSVTAAITMALEGAGVRFGANSSVRLEQRQ